jgi:hypothetical protein
VTTAIFPEAWAGEFEAIAEIGEPTMAQCASLIAPYTLIHRERALARSSVRARPSCLRLSRASTSFCEELPRYAFTTCLSPAYLHHRVSYENIPRLPALRRSEHDKLSALCCRDVNGMGLGGPILEEIGVARSVEPRNNPIRRTGIH